MSAFRISGKPLALLAASRTLRAMRAHDFVIIGLIAALTPLRANAGVEPGRSYRGGPLDGIYVGEVIRPDNGVRIIGLKPSKPNASPVPAKDMPALQAFINAFEHRDLSKLDGFVAKNAGQQACAHGFYGMCGPIRPLSELRIAEDCTFNTPYYLGNGKVRLEWLFRGELWYWSEVNLSDGKIRLVRTHPADMPPNHP